MNSNFKKAQRFKIVPSKCEAALMGRKPKSGAMLAIEDK